MQTIDDASRGLSGAASMLASRTGGYFTAFGSVIMLLMIAFGPFFQQLLEYPTRSPRTLSDEARALQNLNYTYYDQYTDGHEVLKSATMAGLYVDLQASSFIRTPTCPTAHCEWDNYQTVEWCSECEDVTSAAKLGDCDFKGHIIDHAHNRSDGLFTFCNVTLGKNVPYPLMQRSWTNELAARYLKRYDLLKFTYATEAIWTLNRLDNLSLDVNSSLLEMGRVFVNYTWNDRDGNTTLDAIEVVEAEHCMITFCDRERAVRVEGGKPVSIIVSTRYAQAAWVEAGRQGRYYEPLQVSRIHESKYAGLLSSATVPWLHSRPSRTVL